MESTLNFTPLRRFWIAVWSLCLGLFLQSWSYGQESPAKSREGEKENIRLQKSVKAREYQGKQVEGEERVVGPKETLWRILIQEKGLSQKKFSRYVILVGSLNPQLKNPNVLPLGSTIFIPIRPDEILGIQIPSGQGQPRLYRVKVGDYLYKILREQLGTQEKKELEAGLGEVKRLNPQKKNWNLLLVGEGITVPGSAQSAQSAPGIASGESQPAAESVGLDYGQKLQAQTNLELLEQLLNVLGNEMNRKGEELLPVQEGTIHMDRGAFPVIVNPKKGQKVILDIGGKIPSSLKTRLEGRNSPVPIVSLKQGASLHEAVNSLIPRLGFQSMPKNRPITVQDQGVGIQLKGEWMAVAPEESGGQAVWIISLTDGPGRTPDYLREYLSLRGMNVRDVLLPTAALPAASLLESAQGGTQKQIEVWPRDKKALVDAFLTGYPVSFTMDRQVVLSLREGIRMDIKMDRFFEVDGKKFAVFFRQIGEEAKRALEQAEGLKTIELDLGSLSTRDLISRLVAGLGESAPYREHRFFAGEGAAKDKVVVTVPGFFFSARSLLITDKEIPKDLHRFFFDRGLRVVYF